MFTFFGGKISFGIKGNQYKKGKTGSSRGETVVVCQFCFSLFFFFFKLDFPLFQFLFSFYVFCVVAIVRIVVFDCDFFKATIKVSKISITSLQTMDLNTIHAICHWGTLTFLSLNKAPLSLSVVLNHDSDKTPSANTPFNLVNDTSQQIKLNPLFENFWGSLFRTFSVRYCDVYNTHTTSSRPLFNFPTKCSL